MTTIIRPTKEHNEALAKINSALTKISKSCDINIIEQCNVELDEAFATLERLGKERKLIEVVKQ